MYEFKRCLFIIRTKHLFFVDYPLKSEEKLFFPSILTYKSHGCGFNKAIEVKAVHTHSYSYSVIVIDQIMGNFISF